LAAERENLLSAANHAVDVGDAELALRIVRHTPEPDVQLGFAVYLPISAILELPGATRHDLYPWALGASAVWAAMRGEFEHVERYCEDALHASLSLASQHERREVELLVTRARREWLGALGQWRESAVYSAQAAATARECGRQSETAWQLATTATCYSMAGVPQAGLDIAREAMALARAAGAPTTIAYCLVALAGTLAQAEPVQARRLLEEALAVRESLDIETASEVTQATLICANIGDWSLALQLSDRSIRHLQWGGEWPWLAGIFNIVARALVDTDLETAARLQGAARQLAVHVAAVPPGSTTEAGVSSPGQPSAGFSMIADLRRQTSQLLHNALDEGRLQQLRAEGEAMDSDQAAAYALDAIRRAQQATAH
jgi:hypothetical protein